MAMAAAIAAAAKAKESNAGFATFASFDAKKSQDRAHGKRKAKESDSDSDSSAERAKAARPAPIRWDNSPTELKPQSAFDEPEMFVAHFIRYMMGQWRHALVDKTVGPKIFEQGAQHAQAIFNSEKALAETENEIAPLVRMYEDAKLIAEGRKNEKDEAEAAQASNTLCLGSLKKGGTQATALATQMSMSQRLINMAQCAYDRDYAAANNHYIAFTTGGKKWQNAVMFGEAKHNKGFNMRRVAGSAPNAFDRDDEVNKYIRSYRRLLQFSQLLRPNEDVSKHM